MKLCWVLLRGLALLSSAAVAGVIQVHADEIPNRDVAALFKDAEANGWVGVARKTRPVDARPATLGEIVITMIAGEGKETQSQPAEIGDWVVRNRCPETGNEEILVKAAKFAGRYEGPVEDGSPNAWRTYAPRGIAMRYMVVSESMGVFGFSAPWGEMMIARPGDAIVQDPGNPKDIYRIAAAAFRCTYEITVPAKP